MDKIPLDYENIINNLKNLDYTNIYSIQNVIKNILGKNNNSYVVKETFIDIPIIENGRERYIKLKFPFIYQTKSGNCILASVANAYSLLNEKLPKGGIYEIRNEAIKYRIAKGDFQEPPEEILNDNSPLSYSDFAYLASKYLNKELKQENIILVNGRAGEEEIINQLENLFQIIDEGNILFLGLRGHANFIKKIGGKYFLFDSMLENGYYQFSNDIEVLTYIGNGLDRHNSNNFFFYLDGTLK